MYTMIEDMQNGKNWKENTKSRQDNLRIFYYNKQNDYKHCSIMADIIINAPFPESI